MTPKLVNVPSIQKPIQSSPGFAKKLLSDFKLDLMGLCQFGCLYCSTNSGNYVRINQKKFAELTKKQLGERLYPSDEPRLTFQWPDVLANLEDQLARKPAEWGSGETLVFSMQTDGFSPIAVQSGLTEKALRLVLEKTSFRIRVLTKNAIVGQDRWVRFFQDHADRFVVGLSIGTLDHSWARKVEQITAAPMSRIKALHNLQDAEVPTYGMLCPVFPDVLAGEQFERLIDLIRPELCEHVWVEPYNNRANWEIVRAGYDVGSTGWNWFTDVYGQSRKDLWSAYATELYLRILAKARAEGWMHKLRYLLYEGKITQCDSEKFRGLQGVLLQAKPGPDGRSQNRFINALQKRHPQ